jgi:hypothetical protein
MMLEDIKIPVKIEIDAEIDIRADSIEGAMAIAEKMPADAFDWLEERVDVLDPRKV